MYNSYNYKPIDYGFIALCPNGQYKTHYPNVKVIGFDKCDSTAINKGLHESKTEWNFVICSKGSISYKLDIKYSHFIKSYRDIMFPVINRRTNFVESNSFFINKKAFLDIGDFLDGDLEESKIIWATTALEKRYNLIGIVNYKILN